MHFRSRLKRKSGTEQRGGVISTQPHSSGSSLSFPFAVRLSLWPDNMDSWRADYREGDSSLPLSGRPPSHSGPLTRDFSLAQAQTSSCPEGSSLSKVRVNIGGLYQNGCSLSALRAGDSTTCFHLLGPWQGTSCPQPSRGQSEKPKVKSWPGLCLPILYIA